MEGKLTARDVLRVLREHCERAKLVTENAEDSTCKKGRIGAFEEVIRLTHTLEAMVKGGEQK